MILSALFFLLGFLVAWLATPGVIAYSRSGVGIDRVGDPRKRHSRPTSRLGGVGVMLGLLVAGCAIAWTPEGGRIPWVPLLAGSLAMFGLGLWDDIKPLGARKKLLVQIAVAAAVYSMGLSVDRVTYPRGEWSVELGGWSLAATMFWLVAVPNIVNLIDGFDGLAGGLGLVMAVTLGVVGLYAEQLPIAWYAFALGGALLGFLWFNFPPAKIFLGDGGAYLVGFTIAALSLAGSHKGSIAAVLLVTVVGLGLPIIDTTLAIGRRALRGFPLFHADDEHIHHRLQDLGFSKRRIVVGLYAACVTFSLVGLSVIWSQGRTIPIAIAAIFFMALVALRYLHYIRDWGDIRARMDILLRRRETVRYALVQSQLMAMEVDRCASAEEFWPIFHKALHRTGLSDREQENGEDIPVRIDYDPEIPWVLHASRSLGTESDWRRIANCFRPAYDKAIQKWHE
jgi:UDP-GlcNAc:undecaprenyl-phosphate GlcNAc-1-phosphate transferase